MVKRRAVRMGKEGGGGIGGVALWVYPGLCLFELVGCCCLASLLLSASGGRRPRAVGLSCCSPRRADSTNASTQKHSPSPPVDANMSPSTHPDAHPPIPSALERSLQALSRLSDDQWPTRSGRKSKGIAARSKIDELQASLQAFSLRAGRWLARAHEAVLGGHPPHIRRLGACTGMRDADLPCIVAISSPKASASAPSAAAPSAASAAKNRFGRYESTTSIYHTQEGYTSPALLH